MLETADWYDSCNNILSGCLLATALLLCFHLPTLRRLVHAFCLPSSRFTSFPARFACHGAGVSAAARRPRADHYLDSLSAPSGGSFSTKNSIVGQTFTAPADSVLTSFAVQLETTANTILSIRAYNPATNTVIGPALFTSASTPLGAVAGQNGYTFNTGGVALNAGSVYGAFLVGPTNFHGFNKGTLDPRNDPYTGGQQVMADNFTDVFVGFDNTAGIRVDLAFTAAFAPVGLNAVPEPGSVALLLTLSVTGAGFLARRKRARASA